jgi:mannose-6-phosphate isomerase
MLAEVEVAPGDVVLNLPGAIHAIGAGIFLYELQQSSDLTYRFYDWDRNDPSRALHIEQSLDVADLDPYLNHCVQPVEIGEGDATRTYLCACVYFAAELLSVQSRIQERPAGECFHILTAIQGAGRVEVGPPPATEHSEAAVPLRAGESVLVPAAIPEYSLNATQPPLRVIKGYVPDLLEEIVLPLQAKGIPDETIRQLGGDPGKSDLGPYLDQRKQPA